VKLAFAVDAIVPPLTGIGRYAWELARHHVMHRGQFDSLRFYFAGQWIDDPVALLKKGPTNRHSRIPKFLRPSASVRGWAERRAMSKHLFHSPNYFLPKTVERGVVTVHDLSVFKYPETHPIERLRHFEESFASTLSRASHLITDSEVIRLEVAEYFGWSMEKITAVRLGVPQEFRPYDDVDLVEPLHELDLTPGNYSLCVSTLEPRKRIDRLLTVYANLPVGLRRSCPLVLAGSAGWLNESLNDQIRRGQNEGWLRYLGFVPEASLPKLYAGARAFFFPSSYEGFGLPLLEALASGVPALASNCSSMPEVADGAACLVDSNDHESLLEGVQKVLLDDAWRLSAITKGLRVASDTTWDKCAQRTLEVCRQFG